MEGKIFVGGGKKTGPFGRDRARELGKKTPTDRDEFDKPDHQ